MEQVLDDGKVMVFFPDYGDTMECNPAELFEVLPWMLKLPFQGIQCRLAGVAPLLECWSSQATLTLEDFGYDESSQNKRIWAKVLCKGFGYRPRSSCYDVLLFDGCHGDFVNIANELVKCGLAQASELPVPNLNIEPPAEVCMQHSASDDDSDTEILTREELCKKNLEDYMDQVYSSMRREILQEQDAAPGNGIVRHGPPIAEPPNDRVPQQLATRSRDIEIPQVPEKLESALRPSASKQPFLSWWQDKCHIYVEVLVPQVTNYSLELHPRTLILK